MTFIPRLAGVFAIRGDSGTARFLCLVSAFTIPGGADPARLPALDIILIGMILNGMARGTR